MVSQSPFRHIASSSLGWSNKKSLPFSLTQRLSTTTEEETVNSHNNLSHIRLVIDQPHGVRKVESHYELSESFDADWRWGWE